MEKIKLTFGCEMGSGPCNIETLNGSPTKWAVVAYYDERHAANAVKFGNGSAFRGQTLNINKI
jgi:hypothetical protein